MKAAEILPTIPAPAPSDAEQSAAPITAAPAHPRDWDFTLWRKSLPTVNASPWKFREIWFSSALLWDGVGLRRPLAEGAMGSVFAHPWKSDSVVKVARRSYNQLVGL